MTEGEVRCKGWMRWGRGHYWCRKGGGGGGGGGDSDGWVLTGMYL